MIRKNLFTILVSALIFYLSMANSANFRPAGILKIPNFDKIVHFGMYFILMITVLLEHRKKITGNKQVIRAAFFPFAYGIFIEILQSFTASRSASFFDALADLGGIMMAVVLWNFIKPSDDKELRLQ